MLFNFEILQKEYNHCPYDRYPTLLGKGYGKAWPDVSNKPIAISSDVRMYSARERRATSGVQAELVASLAHEINNPLEALLNLLYLMEPEAVFTEKGRQYLCTAREEILRISQIVHSALHTFRAAAPQDTDVSVLLRSVLELYQSRLKSRGIDIKTRFCPDGHLAVYPGPLSQTFANLVLNAADAMPQGGRLQARVSAGHERTGRQRHGLRLTFADNGCGIAADQLPKILRPFFTTKGAAGNGLGLALVKDVVEKHRGVLRVRSSTRPGHSGSIFSIFLPA